MKRNRKKKKTANDTSQDVAVVQSTGASFTDFSIEILSAIFDQLSTQKLLQIEHLSRKIHYAVLTSLKFREELDFNEGIWDVQKLTSPSLMCLARKMPNIKFIYNIGALGKSRFTIKKLLCSLKSFQQLEGVTIKSPSVLNSVLLKLPEIKILGCFSNQERSFPPLRTNMVDLPNLCNLTKVHLVGCCVRKLPEFGKQMKHLYFRLVEFTDRVPFFDFYAPRGLECFVMAHCIGPRGGIPYLPVLDALDGCNKLSRLELQRVPLNGGMIQVACESSWEDGGFSALQDITIGDCVRLDERDLGYLVIASAQRLARLRIQPSLSSNVLFGSLATAELPQQDLLLSHLSLGWEDTFQDLELLDPQLYVPWQITKNQVGTITDQGMQLAAQCFPNLESLEINKCPYLTKPPTWHTEGVNHFSMLNELTIKNCANLSLDQLLDFLHSLPVLKYLFLENMFSEPPVGCSRVGIMNSMDKIGLFEKFPEQMNNLELNGTGQGHLPSDINIPNVTGTTNVREKSLVRKVNELNKESKKDEQLPKCTCPFERKDNGSQVDKNMLRQNQKQMKKARIKMHDKCTGTIVNVGKRETVIIPRKFAGSIETSKESRRTRKKTDGKNKTESSTNKKTKKARLHCKVHPSCAVRPETRDQHDSTNDPVLDKRKDAFCRFCIVVHPSLEYIYMNNLGFTQFELNCPKLKTIHITRCKALWRADLLGAKALTNVHVSQCPDFSDESFFVDSVYGLYPRCDKFVSLRPMHTFDSRRFMDEVSSDVAGTVLVMDFSPIPSDTNYNKHRAKSWIPLLSELTDEADDEFGFDFYCDNRFGAKREYTMSGMNENGSKWKMITDIPFLKILADCADIDVPSSSCDPNTKKAGVYCPEAKGHYTPDDAYKDLRSFVCDKRPWNIDMYRYTVVTYVNMCDVGGKPVKDLIPVL